jgi:hypothetical protein
MPSEPIDPKKFCRMLQIDIKNIYLGPSSKLSYCSCPPPPEYLDSEPFDEEYLNDSRYISEKDRLIYEKEFEEIQKQYEMKNQIVYNFQPQMNEENHYNERDEDIYNEPSDEEEEEEYVDDDYFEIVRK